MGVAPEAAAGPLGTAEIGATVVAATGADTGAGAGAGAGVISEALWTLPAPWPFPLSPA